MSLEEKINGEIKTAMLAKESRRLEALRAIKAEILLLNSSEKGSSEDMENKAMQKMVKQRKEAAEIYATQNRPELAETELFQAGVIESFLPKQMNSEELQTAVKGIITSAGALSMADMGKVMGVLKSKLAGKADMTVVSAKVKEKLG